MGTSYLHIPLLLYLALCLSACQSINGPYYSVRPLSHPDSIVTTIGYEPTNYEQWSETTYFIYNEKWQLVFKRLWDVIWEYSYDDHGNLTKLVESYKTMNKIPEEWNVRYTTYYTYDENNKLKQRTALGTDPWMTPQDTTIIEYVTWFNDRHARFEHHALISKQWKINGISEQYYTPSGLIEKEVHFSKSNPDSIWKESFSNEYIYDKYDNLVTRYYRGDNGEIQSGVCYDCTYDELGNILVAEEREVGKGGTKKIGSLRRHIYYY